MMLFEILKKELLSFFRDRKTLLALLLPVLIFPIMFSIAGTQLRAGQESLEQSIPVYCEINSEKSEAQIQFCQQLVRFNMWNLVPRMKI